MSDYFRPLVQAGAARPKGALGLVGGRGWFSHVERLRRGHAPKVMAASDAPDEWRTRLTAPRPAIAGLDLSAPALMGILNVTPDSFSDGGLHADPLAHAKAMVAQGAALIDVGGESTRPGADLIDPETEITRTAPVIAAIRAALPEARISIDTRKAAVARAVDADLINDVSGFTFDAALGPLAAETGKPVCVMHTQGTPDIMQKDPQYGDVVLDVFDWLAARIEALEAMGIPRAQIIADPGIGFGKTFDHNMALIRNISIFHGLGTALLLGVSRKGFIGHIAGVKDARARGPGSVAVALYALGQGVQIIRAHDVAEHAQAIALWRACVA